jgi:hypothetical protein
LTGFAKIVIVDEPDELISFQKYRACSIGTGVFNEIVNDLV